MFLNHFDKSSSYKLNQLIHTLKTVYNTEIVINDLTKSSTSLLEYKKSVETIQNSIIAESSFNSYLQNPEYIKNMLILEAVKIILTEIAPKRRKKLSKKVAESMSLNKIPFSTQLASIASRIPNSSDESIAFANAISSLSTKLENNENINSQDKEILLWIKSLPRPININSFITNGIKEFGSKLLLDREEYLQTLPKVDLAEQFNPPFNNYKDKPVKGLYNYRHLEDDAGNFIQIPYSKNSEIVFFCKKTGEFKKFNDISSLKSYLLSDSINESDTNLDSIDTPEIVKNSTTELKVRKTHTYEYQASMARSELYRNGKYAMSMLQQIDEDSDVEPWIAGALTKSAEILDKVFHYLDYYKTFEPEALPENEDPDMNLRDTAGAVARQNLVMIIEYSIKLFDMIKPGDKLEGWVAMKITSASENISSCKHYMDYLQFQKNGIDDRFTDTKRSTRNIKESTLEDSMLSKKSEKFLKGKTANNSKNSKILKEVEDLARASAILAAKDISNKVQDIAEDVAKTGVEDLMPLVDVIRSQFGADVAEAFNNSCKSALSELLEVASNTKETLDIAIDSLINGTVPPTSTDLESTSTEDLTSDDEHTNKKSIDVSTSDNMTDDIEDLVSSTSITDSEPLGRSLKKSEKDLAENWDATMHTATSNKGMWDDYTIAELKAKRKNLMSKSSRTKDEQKTVKQLDFAIRAKQKDKWGKISETDKNIDEAIDFISKSTTEFKKRYGDIWESKLYLEAWKKFGTKSKEITDLTTNNSKIDKEQQVLDDELTEHKNNFAKNLLEGTVKDPLHIGYGLEGEVILQKIADLREHKKSNNLRLTSLISEEVLNFKNSIIATKKNNKLQEMKKLTPYGVVFTDATSLTRNKKLFETVEERDLWVELNRDLHSNIKLVNPSTFDNISNNIK